jgi:hypothetical protein
MTPPIDRVRAALATLCVRAAVEPADASDAAARAVVGVLRRTGCLDAPAFDDERHMPDVCPVATWVRLETGLACYVSTGGGPGKWHGERPGRAVLVTLRDEQVKGDAVDLPPAVDAAVRLIDASHGAAAKEGGRAA